MLTQRTLRRRIAAITPEMIELRQDLHRQPELGFAEHRTAGIVAERLLALGLEVTTGVAGTGVVGLLTGAAPGRTIALRADMDALPITEENEVPYKSERPGVMHACGHDGHVAMLLGAAAVLAGERENFAGNVKFLFQPAEEGVRGGGAKPMVEAGVLANPAVDAVLGLHLWSGLPVGTLAIRRGPLMAASDSFTAVIKGVGGHGAAPQDTVDPIVAGAQVVTALQTIVSREVIPVEAAVITVGMFHAGTANNIIAGQAELAGTVRTLDPALRQRMPERIEGVIKGVTGAMRAQYEFSYRFGYPVVLNHPAVTELLEKTAAAILGAAQVLTSPQPVMGSEDFAYYQEKVPGTFAFLGAGNPAKGTGMPHHPRYNFDEDALPLGAAIMVQAALRFLAGK